MCVCALRSSTAGAPFYVCFVAAKNAYSEMPSLDMEPIRRLFVFCCFTRLAALAPVRPPPPFVTAWLLHFTAQLSAPFPSPTGSFV